jgi:hypothetical protein
MQVTNEFSDSYLEDTHATQSVSKLPDVKRTVEFSQTPTWVCDVPFFLEYARPQAWQVCRQDFHMS